MGLSLVMALNKQKNLTLIDMYKRMHNKVDKKGNINPQAIKILMYLQANGYNVNKLVRDTK